MNFSNILRSELNKQNKQQKHLAEYLGIKPTRISDWIRTESNPKLTHLEGTAKFLDISLDYLILNKKKSENEKENLTDKEQELLSKFRQLDFQEQIEILYLIIKKTNKK